MNLVRYTALQVLAFRGERAEPPRASLCGVSAFSLFPQDKEGYGSKTSHEEKCGCIFRGVSHLPLRFTDGLN